MKESGYEAHLDWSSPVAVKDDQHAHHTGWAFEPEEGLFILTLHREDDSVIGVAVYTYEQWMNVFAHLKEAKEMVDRRGHSH